MSNSLERPLVFEVDGSPVVGVLHQPAFAPNIGIIMVAAGGPQYHVGCSRQLLSWGRKFADSGIAVLRFDYRGMGDSGGVFKGFEHIDDDLRSAIDQLLVQQPSIQQVVLWGGCNAASAILMYAWKDSRIKHVIVLNPWVYTEAAEARVQVKYYYLQRLMQKSFWLKLLSGKLNPYQTGRSLLAAINKMRSTSESTFAAQGNTRSEGISFIDKMFIGLDRYQGRMLLLLSGQSLDAQQFDATAASSKPRQQSLAKVNLMRQVLPDAGLTFSTRESQTAAFSAALSWLKKSD